MHTCKASMHVSAMIPVVIPIGLRATGSETRIFEQKYPDFARGDFYPQESQAIPVPVGTDFA